MQKFSVKQLCVAVATLFVACFSATAMATDVNFTVSLPQISATDTSLSVRICEEPSGGCRSNSVTIPAGQISASDTTSNVPDGEHHIRTNCFTGCDAPIVSTGYASGMGQSSFNFEDRTTFIVGAETVNFPTFQLATGQSLSGTFSVPIAQSANKSVFFTFCSDSLDICDSSSFTLAQGNTSLAYTKGLVPASDYEVKFNCFSCDEPLFREGFFSATSTNTTTTVRDNATLVDGSLDVTGINLTAIQSVEFTGTVTAPSAVSSNTFVSVAFEDITGEFSQSTSATIAMGETSATYSVFVAPENDWLITADCGSNCTNQDIFPQAYFAEGEPNTTTWAETKSTAVSGSDTNKTKNVTLYPGAEIRGTVNMPDSTRGRTTDFNIFAFNENENAAVYTNASISSSRDSDAYTLYVPAIFAANNPVIVGALPDLDEPNDLASNYFPFAFHNGTANSETNRDNAIPVVAATVGGTVSGIDMTISTGNVISGTINVPDGEDAPRDLLIHMIADQLSDRGADLDGIPFGDIFIGGYGGYGSTAGSGFYLYDASNAGLLNYTPIKISANSGSSRFYSMRISPDANTSWRTYYGCLNCGNDFETYGFFKDRSRDGFDPEETVFFRSQASFVPGGSDYTHDLVLLPPVEEELCLPIKTASAGMAVICL